MSAVTSLSLDPQQFLICINRNSETLKAIDESGLFCINILSEPQQDVSQAFARKGVNKFAEVDHERLASGLPVISNCLAYAACKVVSAVNSGDHRILIGGVLELGTREGKPLVYFKGGYRQMPSEL